MELSKHPSDTTPRADIASKSVTTDKLSRLPHFRPACMKLMTLSIHSNTAIGEFVAVFEADPALASDLLLMANSAEFGASSQIETVRHALTFLGLERVRSLASTIAFHLSLGDADPDTVRPLWAHGIATAIIADELGEKCGRPGLYTTGLVHDMGRLGLLRAIGADYSAILLGRFASVDEATRLERQLCGMDHCEAGAYLADKWRFPVALQASMAAHHSIGLVSEPRQLVRSACEIADAMGYPEVERDDVGSAEELCGAVHLLPDVLRDHIEKRIVSLVGQKLPVQ